MSEEIWRRDPDAVKSAKILMMDHAEAVDLLDIVVEEGVDQLAWVMKGVVGPLRGKVAEIAVDATCELNLA